MEPNLSYDFRKKDLINEKNPSATNLVENQVDDNLYEN